MAFCKNCGKQFVEGIKYCPSCGTICQEINANNSPIVQQPTIVYVQSPQQQNVYVHGVEKSKGITLLLCFFLGGFGIHQFYIGNTIKGVTYLLFCWICYITGIVAIIDFFIFLCMSEERFHQKYDKNY
ncbi:MAG: NINE protein [Bacteroidaceae bacterium]|nr:NINE protein [Bacteroidaceae bacterium]